MTIKPQNILVTADGRCKITDFGSALVGHETRLTKTGSTMGTLGFMAPEQRYDAKSADVRADVFSLDATLWCLLSRAELTELFLADEQPRLMEGLHEAIASIVLRGVAYAPDNRYPDAVALRAELEAAAAQLSALGGGGGNERGLPGGAALRGGIAARAPSAACGDHLHRRG